MLPISRSPLHKHAATEAKGQFVNRRIILSSESIMPSEKEQVRIVWKIQVVRYEVCNNSFFQLTFLTVNPDSVSPSYIFVQEVGSGAAACPKGMYCLHASSTNEDDDDTIDRLIIRDVSKKVWSLQFKVWEMFFIYIYLKQHLVWSRLNDKW